MATFTAETYARPLTIGAVCRRLSEEFPDISISKIRYLEDQGLLAPRRTQGGYRLYAEDDVDRLRTILRLQRDEFLPLRVIRQELSTPGARKRGRRRRAETALRTREPEVDLRTLCDRSGADPAFVRELEDFGLVEPSVEEGENRYPERDIDVVVACVKLARYGLEPRNLKKFRTHADSEAGQLEQAVAPALRSPSPERRQGGLEDLETIGTLAQELSQLLYWRALRTLSVR
jgi:DNA-binding transcriptional MerR regulator